jgi:predicted nucleic acid-binding protein
MRCVVDASVAVKWFFRDADDEDHMEPALDLLLACREGKIQLHQPVHFVAEVAAVLARKKPTEVESDLADLLAIERRTVESLEIYTRAADLAQRYQHHLFDTLYHAVALHTPDATLVTADRRYHAKAESEGRIVLLEKLSLPG